jgi:hypothetical protein
MLELLAGIEAARRVTEASIAMEPPRRRRAPARRSRAAAARDFVSAAIVALGSPRSGARSRAAHPCSEVGAD